MVRSWRALACVGCLLGAATAGRGAEKDRHLLYVAVPGIRNYLEYGGIGVLVFDMDHGYKFVERIPSWKLVPGQAAENVKGIAADAKSGRLYVSTVKRLAAFDLGTGKMVWDKAYEGGCDRMAVAPDGKTLYVPALEGPFWTVVNAVNGDVIAKIPTVTGSHNTIYSADGSRVYLASLHLEYLMVADPATNTIVSKVGPFSNAIRPFTVNGSNTLCFVNVNALLGFEVGDLRTGKQLYKVQVQGYEKGPTKRHGCPSHGIALTPDEKELWLADGANSYVHIFDATQMPPKQVASVKTRDMPGWITLSIDGRYVIPSSGDVIDRRTRKIAYTLQDETGQAVQSEKMLEIDFKDGKAIRAGNQFGVGAKQ